MLHKLYARTTAVSLSPPHLTNHMDAWGATLGITLSATLLHQAFNLESLYLIVSITIGYWLAFAINDYFDAPYDAADPQKAAGNFFVQQPDQQSKPASPSSFFISIFIGPAFLSSRGWRGLYWWSRSPFLLCGAIQCHPLRFKTRPGLDLDHSHPLCRNLPLCHHAFFARLIMGQARLCLTNHGRRALPLWPSSNNKFGMPR